MEEKKPTAKKDNREVVILRTFEGVSKYKSVFRAIRRNNVSPSGVMIPKRPFHNKANTSKRKGVHSR
jgi:hypothetical protein